VVQLERLVLSEVHFKLNWLSVYDVLSSYHVFLLGLQLVWYSVRIVLSLRSQLIELVDVVAVDVVVIRYATDHKDEALVDCHNCWLNPANRERWELVPLLTDCVVDQALLDAIRNISAIDGEERALKPTYHYDVVPQGAGGKGETAYAHAWLLTHYASVVVDLKHEL
jgi:hypothetical protein